MLLLETSFGRITDMLTGTRQIALVPAASRDRAVEIAAEARDHGYGMAVIEVRSRGLVVLVVGESEHERRLRRDAGMWGGEVGIGIAADQIERVYVSAGWMTALAHSQGADVGRTL